jgi:hypothetical protein
MRRFLPIAAIAFGLGLALVLSGDATATPGSGTTTQTVGRATMPAAHLNSGDFTLRHD